MGHLPAPEAQGDLGLVAFAEKPHQASQLHLVVVLVGAGPELHFLDLDLLLLELGLVLLLALLVLELAVIHDPAYRRLGLGGDLHQIEIRFLGLGQGFPQADDTQLLALHTYQSDRRYIDFAVDPRFLVLCYLKPLEKARSRSAASAPRVVHSLSRNLATKACKSIWPRSSPPRLRIASLFSWRSFSPTTTWNGTRCMECSRIL